MNPVLRLPVRLALGAALVLAGAAIGSVATWSMVPGRACTSCVELRVSAPDPASCVEGLPDDETELVQLARLAHRGAAKPARAHAGLHLTRWASPRP